MNERARQSKCQAEGGWTWQPRSCCYLWFITHLLTINKPISYNLQTHNKGCLIIKWYPDYIWQLEESSGKFTSHTPPMPRMCLLQRRRRGGGGGGRGSWSSLTRRRRSRRRCCSGRSATLWLRPDVHFTHRLLLTGCSLLLSSSTVPAPVSNTPVKNNTAVRPQSRPQTSVKSAVKKGLW